MQHLMNGVLRLAGTPTFLQKVGCGPVREYFVRPNYKLLSILLSLGGKMVSIKGQGIDNTDDLSAYADAIDYDALEKVLEK